MGSAFRPEVVLYRNDSMIRQQVIEQHRALSAQFQSAKPFKHLCIDNFLETDAAESLLRDFPKFDPLSARNEFGEVGRKAVHSDLVQISSFYEAFYRYLSSERFLKCVSDITGIPDLLFDPKMYGGGTHENLHGQGLYPHVDFNYDLDCDQHRRLNLLLYLNKEWNDAWGGSIQLHSNPRKPKEDQFVGFSPIFNRAVIFETNEYSWHGFPQIDLPADRQHLSRKCLSLYLYTKDRPAHEIVPPHGTFYVMDPLPAHIKAGLTLTVRDVEQIEGAVRSRDVWIEHYQMQEMKNNGTIQSLQSALERNPFLQFGARILPVSLKRMLKRVMNRS
jgi:Rps23 Pro-64 3,4-dihydroxylase Tpa1-like proline 4-hydroxylase